MLLALLKSNRGIRVATPRYVGFADRVCDARNKQGHGFLTLAVLDDRGVRSGSGSAKSAVIS